MGQTLGGLQGLPAAARLGLTQEVARRLLGQAEAPQGLIRGVVHLGLVLGADHRAAAPQVADHRAVPPH
jgi:hypothetical protein